jgi:hypothetical protein
VRNSDRVPTDGFIVNCGAAGRNRVYGA